MRRIWIPGAELVRVLDQAHVDEQDLGESFARKARDIREGRQEAVTLDTADGILSHVGLPHWVHILADDHENYVPSWMPRLQAAAQASGEKRRKYHTEEERVEASRENSRRSSRRLGRKCVCGTPITNNAKTCFKCYIADLPRSPHGTMNRYSRYSCRCSECRSAASTYHRDRRLRLKAAA